MDFKMNANELAEIIEHLENAKYIGASKAATMLRQQQAEIDKLKNLLLDNQILLDKTLNAWAKEMERKK
jgi:UDP-N-acetylglucosamine:LPS N-acetylglucosamine transferase